MGVRRGGYSGVSTLAARGQDARTLHCGIDTRRTVLLFVLPAVLPRASKLAVAGRGALEPAEGRANDIPVRALPAVDGRDGRAGPMRSPAIVAIGSSVANERENLFKFFCA